jgi:putative membrane protein
MKIALTTACLLIAAPMILTSPASAQSLSEKTGVNSALGISPSTPDFVKEAAIADMFEIQSSQLAEQKDAGAKTFADQMIADHQKTSAELKAAIDSGKINAVLPTQLDTTHQDMLTKLQGLSGTAFAQQYQKDQVSAHKDAVSLFTRYGKSGDNETLRQWASATLPTLQQHLDMAQKLRTTTSAM